MLKWAVSGGSGGKGTPGLESLDKDLSAEGHHTQMAQKREVNNNDDVDFGRLPPLPSHHVREHESSHHVREHESSHHVREHESSLPPEGNPRFMKGSDPLYQTARGRLQSRRSRLNDQINRELRLRSGAENLLKATNNRKLQQTVSVELSFVNSNLQLLKEEMADLNSSVDIYQGNNCAHCIPMIPLGLKETKEVDFINPLKEVLSDHYHDSSDSYYEALEELQKIRQACRTPVRSNEGVDLLFKYYNYLYFVEKRFFSPQKALGIYFEWYDSLTGVPSSQRTVGFEKGSILFNIGALLTQMGARQDRTTLEGLEGAVENFQKAAGAFKYLRDHFTHAPSKDMQGPTLEMLIHLLLAQSQECLFEKKLLEGAPSGVMSHITMAHEASMVSDMYKDTQNLMFVEPVSQYTPSPWTALVQAKTFYYKALAHYHTAVTVLEQTDRDSLQVLTEHFDNLHVWSVNRKFENSVAAKTPRDTEEQTSFAKAHLRQSILANEDALRVHNQNRQLRKIDTFQEILRNAHDRSLQKFSNLEDEDDFSDLLPAPDIQPSTEHTATVLSPDFVAYKVEDKFFQLGPLAIFSASHSWTAPMVIEMEKSEGQEFGFSVRGDSPVIIAAVEPTSLAQKCGINVSDFIIGVGGVDTRWHKHEDTVALIRKAGSHLILKLITPLDRNYVNSDGSPCIPVSIPQTPNMAQKTSPGSAKDKHKGHRKTGSGSSGSGSGWTLRRKRSSSKDKLHQSEIHGR